MTVGLVILALLVLIAIAAPRYGVDSRSGYRSASVRPVDDVRTVGRALARLNARVRHAALR